MDVSDSVWIKTEPTLDGSAYVVTLEATDDVAVALDPDRALRYARGVLDAAHRAAYDAAVLRQMKSKLKLDLETASQLVADLRKDRPSLDPDATEPLVLEPGVSAFTGEPFLTVGLRGKQDKLGQWSFGDAREHALHVLESLAVAELDSGYFRALVGQVGIEAPRARNVVDDLANHR